MAATVHNSVRSYLLLFYVSGVPSDLCNVVVMILSEAKIKVRTFAHVC